MAKLQVPEAATHVVFRVHPSPNEGETKKQGRPIYDEMEVCDIKMAGNTLSWGTFPAHEFADWDGLDDFGNRAQRTYAQKYNAEYLAFKNGTAEALGGTPLEELPFLTQGKRLELKALHIHTAEAVAGLDGSNLKRLGMGGRELKDKAQAYIDIAAQGADTSYLKAELAARDETLAHMQAQIDALTAGGKVQNTEKNEAPEDDRWATFEDEDIKAYLTDAGIEVDGRWKRARLITEANEFLAKNGKKAAADA